MKNMHSIEKEVKEHQNKAMKRFNPQSSSNITSSSLTFIKTPKKTAELDLELKKPGQQIYDFETRYRTLQQNYRNLCEKARLRRQLFIKQKEQLQRYRELDDLNQKEIQHLRTLIHHERRNQAFHNTNLQKSQCRLHKDERKSSPLVPKQRRSSMEMAKLEIPNFPSCSNLSSLKKNSQVRLETGLRPQFSRYKFVPKLPLQ